MKDALLKDLLMEYSALRYQRLQDLRSQEAQVYRQIPEIQGLRRQMVSALAALSKDRILHPEGSVDAAQLTDRIEDLRATEQALLIQGGFNPDFLELKYRCCLCQDTGYVGTPVKEKCRCLVQQLIDRTYGASEMTVLAHQNFDTFDVTVFPMHPVKTGGPSQRDYMERIRDELLLYAEQFPKNARHNILFTGKTGLGKTFLLNCLAEAVLSKGYTVLKTTAYNLFDQLFQSAFQKAGADWELKHKIFGADCLMIDDLGTETLRNNYTAETLFNILNERCLQSRHTLLSTNLSLTELKDRYSERVTSRLFDVGETLLVRFMGEDIRLKKSPR